MHDEDHYHSGICISKGVFNTNNWLKFVPENDRSTDLNIGLRLQVNNQSLYCSVDYGSDL